MSKKLERVCVTGAGGYLASWLVKLLLSKGYIVHGTVRDPGDEKNAHLKKLEHSAECLELFKADLLDYEGLCSAITGCTGVFHVASPLPVLENIVNPEEEVMEPAVSGTRNVLEACTEARVKKVIIVSSVGAIVLNPSWPKDQVMDEESWSNFEFCKAIKHWYFLSKTRAEREAWEYAKTSELNIVTVCPSVIIGPLLQPSMNTSSLYLLNFMKDELETAVSGTLSFVDVRDTAEAILLVYEKPETKGRYICSSYQTTIQDLVEKLKTMYPQYNYPKRFSEMEMSMRVSSEKLQNIGWTYRPLEETIVDSVNNYVERGDLVQN